MCNMQKYRLKCLVFVFASSVISTFLMHSYLYYNHERMKLQKSEREKIAFKYINAKLREDFIAEVTSSSTQRATSDFIQLTVDNRKTCRHLNSLLLGPMSVNASYKASIKEATAAGVKLHEGCFQPIQCRSKQKVAVIIPFKNRHQHLLTLLSYLTPMLQKQNIMYCIFVAEQFDDGSFNKARVMNAAFSEITNKWNSHQDKSRREFDCFVFHDVDMIPENDQNLYLCDKMPKHLSPAIDKFNYTTGYGTKYGGVTAMSPDNYRRVNGHSNRFWGWGGEDNDMEERINKTGLTIASVNETVGRYKMIPHVHPWWFSPSTGVGSSYRKIVKTLTSEKEKKEENEDTSGLSNIKYNLVAVQKTKLWNKIILDIRSYELENATIEFARYKGSSVDIYSMSELNKARRQTHNKTPEPSVAGTITDEPDLVCIPTYHKFDKMTINRTTSMDDTRYTTVYRDLDEAKQKCTEMQTSCHALVEQVKGRFTLRTTAYVQENNLRYKYGLGDQYDVQEHHYSTAVYVKLCPGDPRYLQFFTEPVMLYGDEEIGPSPRYHTDLFVRVFHSTNTSFVYKSQMMTSHRAIMEERVINQLVPKPWWDSLAKIQYSKTKLVTLSDQNTFGKFAVERTNTSQLLKIRTPVNGLLRVPGCYVVKNSIVEEATNTAVLEWNWWFKMKAVSEEIEKKMLDKVLEKSIEAGRQFNKMMYDKRNIMEKWAADKKKKNIEMQRENLRRQRPQKRGS